MEGMTEEQKEYEAMKLVHMFDKLSRSIKAGKNTLNTCTGQFELIQYILLSLFLLWSFISL